MTARIAIIGSGIAGASAAHALHRYGAQVTVFEQASTIAAEASGNPAAMIMPRLDADDTPVARLHRAAFIYAVRLYESLGAFIVQGVIDTTHDDAKRAKLAANPPLPADWLTINADNLFHAHGGVISPADSIAKMLHGCDVRLNTLADPDMLRHEYDVVVITTGRLLGDAVAAPLSYRAGQVDWAGGDIATPRMGDGYVAPTDNGILFGASHDVWADPHTLPPVTTDATIKNTERLAAFGVTAPHMILGSRASLRAALPDRMPLAGKIGEGIFAIGALGARGFTTAPLLGEHVACQAVGIASPLALDVSAIVSPDRYSGRYSGFDKPVARR